MVSYVRSRPVGQRGAWRGVGVYHGWFRLRERRLLSVGDARLPGVGEPVGPVASQIRVLFRLYGR